MTYSSLASLKQKSISSIIFWRRIILRFTYSSYRKLKFKKIGLKRNKSKKEGTKLYEIKSFVEVKEFTITTIEP